MEYSLKKKIFDFVSNCECGNEDDKKEILKAMTEELTYADVPGMSLCLDDLNEDDETLCEKLGKEEGDDWTIQDCIQVADAIGDLIADEFYEYMNNAIEYTL